MEITRLLFKFSSLESLERVSEVGAQLVGDRFCGLSFNVGPSSKISPARLAPDSRVVGYGIGYVQGDIPAFTAIELDRNFLSGHEPSPSPKAASLARFVSGGGG